MARFSVKKQRFLKRLIIFLLSGFVFVLAVATITFNYYKDDIGRALLLRANEYQKGELTFKNISFNPFVSFPDVSITLKTVSYFEDPANERMTDSIPIFDLEKLHVTFDVVDLMMGNFNLSQILLENGDFNFITYADSSFNLINALNLESDTLHHQQDTINDQSVEFEINLEKVELKNIDVTYNDVPKQNTSTYSIQSVDASLSYRPDTIRCFIKSNMRIDKGVVISGLPLNKKRIQVETSLVYNRKSQEVNIEPSKFSFDRANFTVGGHINFLNNGFIDLYIKGSDKDFSILNLFLTNTGIENIRQGDLYFNGRVEGKLFGGIPSIECSFGMEDVDIEIPNTKQSINKLSMDGKFNSGKEDDLSDAFVKIENLKAELPGGSLNGSFSASNFKSPYLDVNFSIQADITGFEEIFILGIIDSLSGIISIESEFKGKLNADTNQIIEEKNNTSIHFQKVSFDIPGVTQIRKTSGSIHFNSDTLRIKDFETEIGNSDFTINGTLTNLFYLVFNAEKNIEGKFNITSNTYDFPDFFKSSPRVGESFPYRINDIDLDFDMKTSTSALTDFKSTPEIVFDIQTLDAEIKEFLPPFHINSGLFTLGENESPLYLDFTDFDIEIAESELLADVVYNSPSMDPDWLKVDVKARNLNPKKAFVHRFDDSTLNALNGNLDGKMHLDLVLSMDTIVFDSLAFKTDELNFTNTTDTIDLQHLVLVANKIDYNLTSSNNVLESLSTEIDLSIAGLNTKDFKVNELAYKIKADEGSFVIHPKKSQFFEKEGEGYLILKPFDKIPAFELTYKVQQFESSSFLNTFLVDTILSGKMDLDMAITFSGTEWQAIGKSLDGTIILTGNDLALKGVDLDKLIERFKRSQKFSLTDVGAVMLMGPAGLLVTKGTEFASIVVLNPGDSCTVVELSSHWEVNDGVINLADVAFTTIENRMAAKGWINLNTDSLNVQVALLNEKGCSLYSQSVSGKIEEPDVGKVKVMKSLLAPVTNLVKWECEVFYDGKVKQPDVKKQ